MQWPEDHPLHLDGALAVHRDAASSLCDSVVPGARLVEELRSVAGRRVVSLLLDGDRFVVCKVFKSPRARGNHRRLTELKRSPAAPIVPQTLGVDSTGHVWLVEHLAGSTWDECDDDRFVGAADTLGRALRSLHTSGAELDRAWTIDDELTQLTRRAPEATAAAVADICVRVERLGACRGPLVSGHRDCHPKQAVVDDGGTVRWIDLDDAAMAPAGLDLGNMIGHLWRDLVLGRRPVEVCAAAIDGVLAGYAAIPEDLELWVELSMLRLAGLATTRHGHPEWTDAILGELAG
jgi:hypothetical protein